MNARLMGQAHRQRPPRELRRRADAAHDQHLHAGGDKWPTRSSPASSAACTPPTLAAARSTSRAASSCLGQRGLLGGERQDPVSGRAPPSSATARIALTVSDDRQRHGAGHRRGRVRQGRQSVPVGVGQPTLRIDRLTVGARHEPWSARHCRPCPRATSFLYFGSRTARRMESKRISEDSAATQTKPPGSPAVFFDQECPPRTCPTSPPPRPGMRKPERTSQTDDQRIKDVTRCRRPNT